MKVYLPDILLNPALSNRYTTKGVSVSGYSGASPLRIPVFEAWKKKRVILIYYLFILISGLTCNNSRYIPNRL